MNAHKNMIHGIIVDVPLACSYLMIFAITVCSYKYFSYFSTKIYVVATQRNRLEETVLLSTHNTYLK